MSFGFVFWLIMLIELLLGLGWHFGIYAPGAGLGFGVVLFILLALLGWKVFGPPLHP
jgi:hypothetical protein